MRLSVLLVILALTGCMQATSNVYSNTIDPVTQITTVTSNNVTFKKDAGVLGVIPNGVALTGKIVGGENYLTITYYGDSWLFMDEVSFRFADDNSVYKIPLKDVSRDVYSDASIVEWQTISAERGVAKALLNKIVEKSKLVDETRLFVRLDGSDYYVSGYDDMNVGYPSLGSFFVNKGNVQ